MERDSEEAVTLTTEVRCRHSLQDTIPLEKMAGFERGNESDLPFYSKDVSFERYGRWELDPSLQQKHFQYRGRSGYLEELANTISFPDILSELDKGGKCMSMSEWLDAAEVVIQKEQGSGLDDLVAPNGKQLERGDRIALFLAKKVLTAIGDADAAIPLYLAKSGNNQLISMSVLGGLLYMGCPPSLIDVPLRDCAHLKYLLNWGADPNESDSGGKTALHLCQTDMALVHMLIESKADVNVQDSSGDTPLHIAARNGQTAMAEVLLHYGASTSKVNDMNQTALDTAAAFRHFECMRYIHHHTEHQKQMQSAVRGPHQGFEKAPDGKLPSVAELLSAAEDHGVDVDVLKQILDSCTDDGKKVFTKTLTDGQVPLSKRSLLSYLSCHPKVFFKLCNHPVLIAFVEAKWNRLARQLLWFRFLFYLFKTVILTFALAITARPDLTDDQLNTYSEPLDYFRGICEALVLLLTVAKIMNEVVEIVRSGWSYFGDGSNYSEWLYILFTLLIIPFRILNHPGQWIVASLAYFFHGLKIIVFIKLVKLTGAYVETLRIILSRDILRFMIIFLVAMYIFSGPFYLSLRYDDTLVTLPGSNTTSPGGGVNSDLRKLDGEGRLLHEVFFTALRSLTEAGSVLNYYGPSGSLRALSVIMYLAFLFLAVIVLLNVLIAQVSDTYSKLLSTAEGVYLYRCCRYITSLEGQLRIGLSRHHRIPGVRKRGCGYVVGCLMFLDIYIVAQLYRTLGRNWLVLPDVIWIGKDPNQEKSKWMAFKRKVEQLFSEYALDEVNSFTVEEATLNLERKLEHEHSNLADKMDKVLADKAHLVEETKKLERRMEVEVGKLSKQLEEVKSLLCEATKHIHHQQSAPEALD